MDVAATTVSREGSVVPVGIAFVAVTEPGAGKVSVAWVGARVSPGSTKGVEPRGMDHRLECLDSQALAFHFAERRMSGSDFGNLKR